VAAPSPAPTWGSSQILVVGGDDGENAEKVLVLKDKHPGFSRRIYAYSTTEDRWRKAGKAPAGHVTTAAVPYRNGFVIPSGEVRPGVRSPRVLYGELPAAQED
jgi:hypothetical protein